MPSRGNTKARSYETMWIAFVLTVPPTRSVRIRIVNAQCTCAPVPSLLSCFDRQSPSLTFSSFCVAVLVCNAENSTFVDVGTAIWNAADRDPRRCGYIEVRIVAAASAG